MRNVRIDNEAGAQETLFNWAQYQYARYPELELLYHIPNGGKRDARTAANLKRQGVNINCSAARLALTSSTRRLQWAIHRA